MSSLVPLAATLTVLAAGVLPSAGGCPQVAGQWGYGRISAVEVVDGVAYYGMGDDLVVADVRDPAAPRVLGRLYLREHAGLVDLIASPPYLFAVHGFVGLEVFDVEDPTRPVLVGSLPVTPEYVYAVARHGGRLYLSGTWYLYTVDISNPEAPTLLGSVDGGGWDVEVAGRYLYQAEPTGTSPGLRVFDLEAGPEPVEVSYQEIPGAQALRADGSLLFLGGQGTDSFRVFSLADPARPAQLGACTLPDRVYAIEVDARRSIAVTASRWEGMRVVSFADPTAPVEVASYHAAYGQNFYDVERVGEVVHCATDYGGLRAVDLQDPASPVELGHYLPPRYTYRAAGLDGRALVVDPAFGLRILEPGAGWELAETGNLPNPRDQIRDVTVVAGMPVVADTEAVYTVSLEDPSAPSVLGSAELLNSAIAGWDHFVIGGWITWMDVLDLADPQNPRPVGAIALQPPRYPQYEARIHDIAVKGSRAYVATGVAEPGGHSYGAVLFIVDLSVPAQPVQLGHLVDTEGPEFTAVATDGEYAYVPGVHLEVVDVRNPAHPWVVREVDACNGWSLLLADGMLFASSGWTGYGVGKVQVCTLEDPTHPVLLGTYWTGGDANAVAVAGGTLYVADGSAGVIALDLADCRSLFFDGFESGDVTAWSGSGGSQ